MILDSHLHLWSLNREECTWPTHSEALIYRDYTLVDLAAVLKGSDVRSAILVQSQEHDSDTEWLLDQARDPTLVFSVVGWCNFEAKNATDRVTELASWPTIVGLRPMVQHRQPNYFDEPVLDAPLAAMMERKLVLDALVRVPHLAALHRLALRMPELSIVIDHAGKPDIADAEGFGRWHASIAPLADLPNVRCKVSGLLTECGDCAPDAIAPYVSKLMSLFGPDKLMWGSDWPVVNMAGDYRGWLDLAQSLIPANAHNQVFAATAAQTYRISPGAV